MIREHAKLLLEAAEIEERAAALHGGEAERAWLEAMELRNRAAFIVRQASNTHPHVATAALGALSFMRDRLEDDNNG